MTDHLSRECIAKWTTGVNGARGMLRWIPIAVIAVPGFLFLAAMDGCGENTEKATAPDHVTLYCSVDEVFARGVLSKFSQTTGIQVKTVFDSEAGKTTGLVNRIVEESRSKRVRADVFWSGELFNTIHLARMGMLARYDPPTAADIPDRYRDMKHRWTALALRARVIAYDPSRTALSEVPERWSDLVARAVASRLAIANPLFGTTRGHVAAMFALWGTDAGVSFLSHLKGNGVTIADGNSSAVRAVIAGRVDFAATDTDDVWVARHAGHSIDLVYPDMGDGGTLWIPCSVALLRGGSQNDEARQLVDFLVSTDVEKMLAQSNSKNIPVRPALRDELGLVLPRESDVPFDAIVDAMEPSEKAVREILIR